MKDRKVPFKEFLHHNKRTTDKKLESSPWPLLVTIIRWPPASLFLSTWSIVTWTHRRNLEEETQPTVVTVSIAGPSYSWCQCSKLSNFVSVKIPNKNLPYDKIDKYKKSDNKSKFSSYIRKFRVEQLQSFIWQTDSSYMGNICAFPHILGSPSSYMTLQMLHSEFPYIWGKFDFV